MVFTKIWIQLIYKSQTLNICIREDSLPSVALLYWHLHWNICMLTYIVHSFRLVRFEKTLKDSIKRICFMLVEKQQNQLFIASSGFVQDDQIDVFNLRHLSLLRHVKTINSVQTMMINFKSICFTLKIEEEGWKSLSFVYFHSVQVWTMDFHPNLQFAYNIKPEMKPLLWLIYRLNFRR